MEEGNAAKLVDSKRSWFMLVIVFLSLFGVGGLQLSFGTILEHLVKQFGESTSKTVWIGSLVTFFMFITSPLTIFLSRRHGIRVTQFIGGVFLTVGVTTTSLVASVNYMFLTYGVLVGIGGGLVTVPNFAIIPEIFDKHVATATGIAVSGSTFGLMFFTFVLPTLLQRLGWQTTLRILAAIGPLISLTGFAFPCASVGPEDEKAAVQDGNQKMVIQENNKNEQSCWKSIKKKAFALWFMAVFLFGLVEYVPLFLVALCAQDSGVPSSQTKWLNIIYGGGNLLGKLISGPLAQPFLKRDQCKYVYLITLFVYSLSSFLVSLNTEFQWLSFYMTFVGFLHGVCCNMFYIVTLEIAGVENYSTACGFTLSMGAVSWTIGPPLAGFLYEYQPHVRYLLLAISVVCFLASVCVAIIPCVTPRRLYKLHQQDYDFWRVYCRSPKIAPKSKRATAFTVEGATEDVQSSEITQKSIPGTLSKYSTNQTVSTTELVGAEGLQFV